jgi:hypothetical protein
MRSEPKLPEAKEPPRPLIAFAALFGAFLGLALLKFGNPPIMEKWVNTPTGFYEFLLGYPWPIAWGYWLLVFLTLLGLAVARWESTAPRWLVAIPLLWLGWQAIATSRSVDTSLSVPTLEHFCACVVCFYLGLLSLSRLRDPWPFWAGLLCGFLLVLAVGYEQHFGGLQASRQYFFQYVYPTLKEVPPEYLKKISSNRIFSTLFYPNALAGAVLLLLPGILATIWQADKVLTSAARAFLVGLVGIAALMVLFWSGSKGGWLLALFLGVILLLRLPIRQLFKIVIVIAILIVGLSAFFWTYAAFFKKGATSVSARFDYWRAAVETTATKPLLGTGPGTFYIPYHHIKRPESEMTRLVHNDYLEQASDSGVVGFLAYVIFIVSAVIWCLPKPSPSSFCFLICLGLLGWILQGFVEFGLYIPALAWPAFTLLGWLLGQSAATRSNPIDKPQSQG